MSEPFIGEILMVGFNFAPRNYALCDGQLLPIAQNQSLFSLLGTMYGGDGRTTFALPDLRGRVPVSASSTIAQGAKGGEETHTLTVPEMAAHTHVMQATSGPSNFPQPNDSVVAATKLDDGNIFTAAAGTTDVDLGPLAISDTGSGAAHDNVQPVLVINYCIALQGLFPSRS